MGIFLMIGLLVGILVGLAISAAMGGFAMFMTFMTHKRSTRRRHIWLVFGAAMALLLPVLVIAVRAYPLPAVRPGSDYDILFKNLFLSGLGYAAIPGVAALLAFVATLVMPGQSQPTGRQKQTPNVQRSTPNIQ